MRRFLTSPPMDGSALIATCYGVEFRGVEKAKTVLVMDDLGDANEMWRLGMHANDVGDEALAKWWWRKAADLGNQYAIDELARFEAC